MHASGRIGLRETGDVLHSNGACARDPTGRTYALDPEERYFSQSVTLGENLLVGTVSYLGGESE